MSTLRYALYVSVSSASESSPEDATNFDQDPEAQEQPLRELIAQRGGHLYKTFFDRVSREKEHRPGLDALMVEARRRAFDVLVMWRFDRLARSVKQLVLILEEFRGLGIDFVSHQEALDTTTQIGKPVLTIIAAMAELERRVVEEKVVVYLQNVRQQGKRSGKPIGRPRAIFSRSKARELRTQGWSWRKIAKTVGVSTTTVRRACKGSDGRSPFEKP
jgi:DNA invertase Pin-like site-specific DNA recombinase